jgi:uncharacterized protein Usg
VKSAVKLTIKLERHDEILPLSEWQVYGIACKLNNSDSLIKPLKSVVKLTIKLERHDEIIPLSEWQVYGIACKLNNSDSSVKYVKPDSADLQSVPVTKRHEKLS